MTEPSANDKELLDALRLEAVRQAELQREDLDLSDEYDAAVYAMWYLLNPLHLEGRDSVGTSPVCKNQLDAARTGSLQFTAHAHHAEPPHPSPDDRSIFTSLHKFSRTFIHFLSDRFRIRRI